MVYIYTENFFAASRAKNFIKLLLGRAWRGPKAVEESLLSGLRENGVAYKLNERKLPVDTACVISGSRTLRWALEQKRVGMIKKIVAGPNIVVFPQDDGGVLRDPLVDVVVVPSLWVKEKYIQLAPELKRKIAIWPAGVAVPSEAPGKKDIDFLVYNKIGRAELYTQIVAHLKRQGFTIRVLDYGNFKRADYFTALTRSKFEIYLSESESQGLAMLEAWARGVPTLVWDRGFFASGDFKFFGNTSAPYLTARAGATFKNFEEFEQHLPAWMQAAYDPKAYVEENFTNAASAQSFMDIIGKG